MAMEDNLLHANDSRYVLPMLTLMLMSRSADVACTAWCNQSPLSFFSVMRSCHIRDLTHTRACEVLYTLKTMWGGLCTFQPL